MMRSLKIFWVFLLAIGLIAFMGSSSLLMASHATHFYSLKGPGLPLNESGCYVCHADGRLQCQEAPLFADGTEEVPRFLETTTVCDPCHSPGGAFDGVNDPVIGAKANWDYGVYEEDGTTLKSGKEKWCATCHDQDPPETVIPIDDFEGYQCEADCDPDPDNPPVLELRSNWVRAADALLPELDTDGGPDGSQCMHVGVRWNRTTDVYGVARRTFALAIDLTEMDYVNFYVKIDDPSKFQRIRVRLVKSPGGELCGADFYTTTTLVPGVWKLVSLPRSSFDDTTWGEVSEIQFRIFEISPALDYEESVYIDTVYFTKTEPLPGGGGPNVVGDNQTYGYYVTGHAFSDCTWCHDSTKTHIDGQSLPVLEYIKNTPNPTNFRFYDDSAKQMKLPYNNGNTSVYDAQDFALCYWCHDEANILDTSDEDGVDLNTNFRDQSPNEMCWWPRNLHYMHLVNNVGSPSTSSCVHCHDPHGNPNPAMTRKEMADSIYFDVNGCKIDQGADSDGDGIDDWHDPDVNRGLVLQDTLGGHVGEGLTCSEACHMSIWVTQPNDPPCNPEDNLYTEPGICLHGYYTRDYKSIPHGVGACGDCHEGHAFESHNIHTEANAKGPTPADCSACHGVEGSYSLDNLECEACHGIGCTPPPQGWIGGIDSIVASGACDTCHSASGAAMAKDNWEDGVYDEAGVSLREGKEGWCAGCHDDVPANSKADGTGIYAPNVMGNSAGTYGYNISGHGRPSANLTCDVCHDFTRPHIDHDQRTYDVDESTWLIDDKKLAVINSYNDGYRLNPGLEVPTPWSGSPEKCSLCINCHMSILGTATNFWFDRGSPDYYHPTHMQVNECWAWDSDADGKGGSACQDGDSGVSCPTCHNVHGSPMDVSGTLYPNPAMVRHGELPDSANLNFRWYTEGYGGQYGGELTSNRVDSLSGAIWCMPPSCASVPCHTSYPYYNRTGIEFLGRGIVIDDFESYDSDADLQNKWTSTEDAKLPRIEPLAGGVTGPDGSQCMRARIVWTQTTSSYGTAKRSYDPYVDLRTANSMSFYVKVVNTAKIERIVVRLKKYPEATLCEATLFTSGLQDDVWEEVSFPRVSFDDASWGKLSEIQFQIHEYDPDQSYAVNVYFDDIRFQP